MTTDNPNKKYFEIVVSCDYRITDSGETSPYLIYQGIELDHKVRLTKDYDGIIFRKSSESAKDFVFTGANISPTVKESNIYQDLKISAVLNNLVCIDDHQLNTADETIGNITLYFILTDGNIGQDANSGKLKVFYSSDPEVINTGVLP